MSVQNAQLNDKTLNFVDMKAKLTQKFLYGADSSAMQLLLNLYDLEEKIHNIFPSYVSMKNLKKDILSFLRRKENRALFANSLTDAIYDDINRFELVMYLAGYKCGYSAASEANELEVISLSERCCSTTMWNMRMCGASAKRPSIGTCAPSEAARPFRNRPAGFRKRY